MGSVLNSLKKVVTALTCIFILYVFPVNQVAASEVPRFDFSKSLAKHESHRDRYMERVIFESSDSDFKKFRIEQIEGIPSELQFLYDTTRGVYVTVLFNVTDDVPEGIDLYLHKESTAKSYFDSLFSLLDEREKKFARLKIVGEPDYITNPSNQAHYEQIDLFIDKPFVKHIVNHPKFMDIGFSGASLGIAFSKNKVRLRDPDRSVTYKNSLLRRGFYREVEEALQLQENVNVHVQLKAGETPSDVIKDLDSADYHLIRKGNAEMLITLNSTSAKKLNRDPRVKLMKDYEFHHDLGLKRGVWNPYPLSEVRQALTSEIIQIPFRSRANLYQHPTKVFESKSQLNKYFEEVRPNGYVDYKVAILDQDIDFSKKNLILYSQDESSGSIRIRPRAPFWVDGNLVVALDRSTPGLQTANLVQHFFAYVVDKSIPTVTFQSNQKKSIIQNSTSE